MLYTIEDMSWVIYALLAAFLYAVVGIVDKFTITKWIKNPFVPPIIFGAMGFLFSAAIYFFQGFAQLSTFNIALAIFVGIISVVASVAYFKAAKIEEISRLVPMIFISNVFVVILAAVFIGEIFTLEKYAGIFLLIFGATMISSRKFDFKPGKAFWLAMLSGFIWASTAVIVKYLLSFADFWTIFSYTRIGMFIGILPLAYFYLNDFFLAVRKHGNKVIGVMSVNEILALSGIFSATYAMSIGPVTLVQSLISVEPFIVFILSIIISIFLPKILKEEIDRKTLFLKAVAITAVIIGAVLVA